MNKTLPVICITLSGILWGCISIFMMGFPGEGPLSGGLSGTGLSTLGVSCVRLIFAAVIYALFMLIKDRKKLKIDPRDIWMFLLSGVVSVAFFNFLYTYTVIHSQASIGVVLLYTSPIFTMILAAIFFKEKLTLKKIAALILVFAGCVLVSGLIGGSYKISFLVLITGLGSGLFWGSYTIFSRITLRKYTSETASVWSVILAGVVMIPFAVKEQVPAQIVANPRIIWWGIGIAVFSTVLPYALYTYGLTSVESGKASVIVSVELIAGNIVGMVIFGEPHDPLKITGIVLIVLAILILNLKLPKKEVDNKNPL